MTAGKSKEEDAVDKACWSKEEEVMLIHEHGKARANGVSEDLELGRWVFVM